MKSFCFTAFIAAACVFATDVVEEVPATSSVEEVATTSTIIEEVAAATTSKEEDWTPINNDESPVLETIVEEANESSQVEEEVVQVKQGPFRAVKEFGKKSSRKWTQFC